MATCSARSSVGVVPAGSPLTKTSAPGGSDTTSTRWEKPLKRVAQPRRRHHDPGDGGGRQDSHGGQPPSVLFPRPRPARPVSSVPALVVRASALETVPAAPAGSLGERNTTRSVSAGPATARTAGRGSLQPVREPAAQHPGVESDAHNRNRLWGGERGSGARVRRAAALPPGVRRGRRGGGSRCRRRHPAGHRPRRRGSGVESTRWPARTAASSPSERRAPPRSRECSGACKPAA